MIKKILKTLKDTFEEKLQAKNSWGKNEAQELFRECLTATLLEIVFEASSPLKESEST